MTNGNRGVILLLLSAWPMCGQPRLGEFLGVKAWKGKVTVTVNDSGTINGVFGAEKWSLSSSVTVDLVLDQFSAGQFWGKTITGTGQSTHQMISTLGDCTKTDTIRAAGQVVADGAELGAVPTFYLYAGPGDVYSFLNNTVLAGQVTTVQVGPSCSGTLAGPPIPVTYWPADLSRGDTFPLPSAGLMLTRTEDRAFTFPFPSFNAMLDPSLIPKVKAKVTWTFEPLAVDDLIVEVTSAKYQTWMPSAAHDGSTNGPATPGEGIELIAELKNKDGTTPNVRVVRFLWELTDVSREPGIAINWPPSGAPGNDPDLKFEPQTNQISLSQERITVETRPGQYLTDKAVVRPYDWGAWGVVTVTAELTDGRKPKGRLKDTGDSDIRLPKRALTSFIADQWKKDRAVDQPDADDAENIPVGDGNRGDGLTLYEEYRGFYENGKHVTGDPKVKKYFIRNLAGDAALGGIVLFKRISELDVHFEMQENELSARVVNFLHGRGPHVVDQHAVNVGVMPGLEGYAQAVSEFHHPDTPKNINFVMLPQTWPAGRKTRRAGVTYADVSLAHELLHACNVYHHAEPDVVEKTWERNPSTGQVQEDGVNVVLMLEATKQDVSQQLKLPDTAGLGIKRGAESGDDNCVMRYDNATAYVSDTRPELRWLAREVAGVSLCTSAKGTGVNEAGRDPQSRYGDAVRGDCKHQILVNDRVPAPRR